MRLTRCKVADVGECTRESKIVRGYCSKHRYRFDKFGNPHFVPKRPRPPGAGKPAVPDATVQRWRRLRSRGWTGTEIAREYGVARDTVYRRTSVTDVMPEVHLAEAV